MGSQGIKWVIPALGVSFFVVRNLQLFSYCLLKWIPAVHQRTGMNWACRATSITQQSPKHRAQPLHGVALEKGVMGWLPSFRVQMQCLAPTHAFQSDITSNGIPTAARLSALMPPPTTAYSVGHCPHPLKDGVAWGAETARSLPCMRAALLTAEEQFLPVLTSCTHVQGVKTSSDIKTHCSALAAWKNKITGRSAKQAGGSGMDRGRRDKVLNLPSAPKRLVILIYV